MVTDTVGAERSNLTGVSHRASRTSLPLLSRVEGIVLHVEANDAQPSENLTFYKAHSRTIAIGRKSSQGGTEHDPERALFRCPVVSRKHAKITFTEYGNVCRTPHRARCTH